MQEINKIKQSIIDLCAIESVQQPPLEGMPFGKGVNDALIFTLNLANSMGFETVNYDGYAGEIIWHGEDENEQTMGILCHLDVVKAGRLGDWKYPPFTPTEEDGKIYARGTLDDKGPTICVLYMLKELKDEGFKPKKTIKFILGCNEESGWECIKHYKKVAKMPDFGFSPDGNFPVLYAEKGIYHARFEFDCSPLIKICKGGEMANMVCDYAYAVAPVNEEAAIKYGLTVNGEKVESFGVSAHGSTPDKGKNAIAPLLLYLAECGLIDKYVYDSLFGDCYGLKKLNDETGYLTMSPDIIEAQDGKMYITVDFRYPATFDGQVMIDAVKKIAPSTLIGNHQLPLFNSKDSFLIKTLLNIYNEETNSDLKPMAIGGGTYARALPIGVAFGPEFPGEDAPVHEPNEYITVKNIEKMCAIYKRAIKELTK
ncbi:MAG: Sapep family Mn(2+)-dependent dipeptidase [Clostridia bacterium]|nr:Sapep family Mn(2+)-dependent dipeptidase [Clostridia bacterium]